MIWHYLFSLTIIILYDASMWLLVIYLSWLVIIFTILYALHVAEMKKDQSDGDTGNYPELVVPGEWAPTLVLSDARRQAGEWGSFTGRSGRF